MLLLYNLVSINNTITSIKVQTTDNQSELFTWVDENDWVLGSINRGEAHSGSFKIHRGVWVMVFNDRGEMFLQKRSLTKDNNPGVWSISVGGHVTFGQAYEEAARREFFEELGVAAPILTFLHKFRFLGKQETEIGCVYRAVYNGPFTLHPVEIDQGAFFALSDLERKVRRDELVLANWAMAIIQAECGVLPERPERQQFIIKVF